MGVIEGSLRIRIQSADLEGTLSKLSGKSIEISDIFRKDYLTAEITIPAHQLGSAEKVLSHCGCRFEVLRHNGVFRLFWKVLKRPVLLLGLLMFMILISYISGRIFFINITGNEEISAVQILSQAEACGIRFGTKAVDVRSEEVKNALLQRIPGLQWVGITTSGTVATIHVTERSNATEQKAADAQWLGIYAAADGVISEIIVERGTPLVRPGDHVKEGELLVSGYTDCGIKIRAEIPDAEIFAYTRKEISLLTPHETAIRGEFTGQHRCFQLRIGKKVIKLCNHSRIQTTSCVKMYEEDYWSLPGGFELPVSVMRVTHRFYETNEVEQWDTSVWLPNFAKQYLLEQMIAGEILDEELHWNSFHELTGIYSCHEMIGQVKCEENLEHNAEDN